MKVEAKIPCLRKAASQFPRMQICYVCTKSLTRENLTDIKILLRPIIIIICLFWFSMEKNKLSLFLLSLLFFFNIKIFYSLLNLRPSRAEQKKTP